jgi:gamma-glutamylcysteine synthetase
MSAVENVDRTPSARLIAELGQTGLPFVPFALQVAQDYRDYFLDLAPEHNGHRSLLISEHTESLQRQRALEDAGDVPFDAFVANYLG